MYQSLSSGAPWVAIDIETHPDLDSLKLAGLDQDPDIVPTYNGLPATLRDGPKIGNLTDPVKIEAKEAAWEEKCAEHRDGFEAEFRKKCSVDPFLLSIHLITVYRRQEQIIFSTELMSEIDMLKAFFDLMLGRTGEIQPIVTQNGIRFDAKALWFRSVVFFDLLSQAEATLVWSTWLGAPWKIENTHIDLMNYYGKSLRFLAKRVLGREKGFGGGIVPVNKEGWIEEARYCMEDSRQAYDLAVKAKLIQPDGDVEITNETENDRTD